MILIGMPAAAFQNLLIRLCSLLLPRAMLAQIMHADGLQNAQLCCSLTDAPLISVLYLQAQLSNHAASSKGQLAMCSQTPE